MSSRPSAWRPPSRGPLPQRVSVNLGRVTLSGAGEERWPSSAALLDEKPRAPGWYLHTPAGPAGPFRYRDDAVTARPPGTTWPISRVPEPCGCGGLCDPGEPCPMARDR